MTLNTEPVQVRRAYKFRAYPTRPQEGRTARLLADHCDSPGKRKRLPGGSCW